MATRSVSLALLAGVGLLLAPAVLAQGLSGAPASAIPPVAAVLPVAEARAWLARIQEAARGGNYQGTLVYRTGSGIATSRVWHYTVGSETFERLEAQDGRQQRVLRHNDTVHTLWPQTQVAVVERRETIAAWSTTPQSVDPQALEQYELRREPNARVAGRDAAVLILEPRDTLRYAQRLWADLASGLMLRADVIGELGGQPRGVIESTAFTEVVVGTRPQPDAVLQPMRQLDGYRIVRPPLKRTSLESEGWMLTRPVNGFRLAGVLRRGMEGKGGGDTVLHAVFSDGIAHVSVFVEPYDPQRHPKEQLGHQGATSALLTRRGEHWITVVGDVPPPALKQFALALERSRP
jgi:sigma-E factor negative regulatory protein RseB